MLFVQALDDADSTDDAAYDAQFEPATDESDQTMRSTSSPTATEHVSTKQKDAHAAKPKALQRNENGEVSDAAAGSIDKPFEIHYSTRREDEHDIFGRWVAVKIRKIDNARMRAELCAKISQSISETELACLSSPQQPANGSFPATMQDAADVPHWTG